MSTASLPNVHQNAWNMRARQNRIAIGPIPPVEDLDRRAGAERDFQSFCETYFSHLFPMAWSPDHLVVISKIENSVLHDGLFAMAMPRGTGKTTLCEIAGLWSILYGHHHFITLIGADKAAANQMLESVKIELEHNELLAEDFPAACVPIRELEGQSLRCKSQTYTTKAGESVQTMPSIRIEELVLPTIENSVSSGAVVKVAGITGKIRGMKHKTPDGKNLRPSLVIVDDPQTDESANSETQCQRRINTLNGAILNLAGPGKRIAGIMPCTVIQPGDMADRMLDPKTSPQWKGERTKMVYEWPDAEEKWEEYAEIQREDYRGGGDGSKATEFYAANREEMDAGSRVAWPERFSEDRELSALQHAFNKRLEVGEAAFLSEFQNDPMAADGELLIITPEQIEAKINGYDRGRVPNDTDYLTAFIDVQKEVLFYVVVAWSKSFSGQVIDYGAWPEQKKAYWHLSDIDRGYTRDGMGWEASLFEALGELSKSILGRAWIADDGSEMKVARCAIDAAWGASTPTVEEFCRQTDYPCIPSQGMGIGASSKPFGDFATAKGGRRGDNWYIPPAKGKPVRKLYYDTNYYKSFCHARLATAQQDKGSIDLFKRRPLQHKMFIEHLVSEYPVRTFGRGREVDEWKLRPNYDDNHWFDCLVGTCVLAAVQGAVLTIVKAKTKAKRRNVERVANL